MRIFFIFTFILKIEFKNNLKNNPMKMKALFGLLALFAFVNISLAQSVEGVWKTIDDETQKEKSYVEITIKDGKLFGTIIKLIDPDEPNPLCDDCKGAKKNKPITGMQIIMGLEKDGDVWKGGDILDPGNGKEYDCKLWLESADVLTVRGFMGISLLGRSQTWYRVK